jgi:hypothetical protein
MFKTDPKSLEELSFLFNEQDIARFRYLLECIKSDNLTTLSASELERLANGLNAIGRLKLDKKFYAFHVEDNYAEEGSDGVEVYQRQGNMLEPYIRVFGRDRVMEADEVARELIKRKVKTVYTGPIPYKGEFLGLPAQCDDEHPVLTNQLDDIDIIILRDEGIDVIVFDALI